MSYFVFFVPFVVKSVGLRASPSNCIIHAGTAFMLQLFMQLDPLCFIRISGAAA
jgi:hypothetical protein